MPYLYLASRVMLGVVFIVACAGKARSAAAFTAFAASLRDLGWLPRRHVRAAAAAIPAAEATVAVLVAIPMTGPAGLAAAIALLGALTAGAAVAIRNGRRLTCNCFGASGSAMGSSQLVRNAVLIAAALAGLLAWQPAAGHVAVSTGAATFTAGLAFFAGLLLTGWDELGYLLARTARPESR